MLTLGKPVPRSYANLCTFIFQTHTSWIHKAKLQSGYFFFLLLLLRSSSCSPPPHFQRLLLVRKQRQRTQIKEGVGIKTSSFHVAAILGEPNTGSFVLTTRPQGMESKEHHGAVCGWKVRSTQGTGRSSFSFPSPPSSFSSSSLLPFIGSLGMTSRI